MTELDVSALIAGTTDQSPAEVLADNGLIAVPEPTNSEMMRLHAEADAVEHAQALVDAGAIDPIMPTAPVAVVTEPEPVVSDGRDDLDRLMDRIAPVDEVSPYLKQLIYGFYGCGKTVYSATGPRTLHFDVEDGAKSIRNHKTIKSNVMVLPFRSVGQFDLLLTSMENEDPRLDEYELLVLDSATAFQQAMATEHIKREAAANRERSKYLPADGDTYLFSNMMKDFLTRLKFLRRHVIVTALAQEIKDDMGRMLIRPELSPKVSTFVGGLFDLVGYMSAVTNSDGTFTNYLQTVQGERVMAKTRIGGLAPSIENPTFNGILEAFIANGRL